VAADEAAAVDVAAAVIVVVPKVEIAAEVVEAVDAAEADAEVVEVAAAKMATRSGCR